MFFFSSREVATLLLLPRPLGPGRGGAEKLIGAVDDRLNEDGAGERARVSCDCKEGVGV
jgi:hypothetical protein